MEELPNILWSYHTIPQEGTGMIPFHLVYDGETLVPTEIGISSARVSAYSENNAEKHSLEMDLVEDSRDRVAARIRVYKQRMCQAYNRKVILHSFQVGGYGLEKNATGRRSWEAETSLGRTISNAQEAELRSLLSTGLKRKTIRTPIKYFPPLTLSHLKRQTLSY